MFFSGILPTRNWKVSSNGCQKGRVPVNIKCLTAGSGLPKTQDQGDRCSHCPKSILGSPNDCLDHLLPDWTFQFCICCQIFSFTQSRMRKSGSHRMERILCCPPSKTLTVVLHDSRPKNRWLVIQNRRSKQELPANSDRADLVCALAVANKAPSGSCTSTDALHFGFKVTSNEPQLKPDHRHGALILKPSIQSTSKNKRWQRREEGEKAPLCLICESPAKPISR